MFLIYLVRFFKGYVNVFFIGDMSERILNICAANSISLWNIEKKNKKIYASLAVSDFFKLKDCRKKCEIRPHIVYKRGLPFLINKNKHRMGFIIGIIIFVILISLASSRIWNIKVNGNYEIEDEKIISACRNYGIYEGVGRSKIDTENSALKLPIDVDGIAWCAFNIEGTTLNIEIEEISKEEYYSLGEPCNLLSKYDGIITRIEVKNGYSRVKVGDSVAKGDILVDGAVELKNETVLYTHSEGKVYANTHRSVSFSVPKKTKIKIPTGKSSNKNVLSFFGIRIPLYLGKFTEDYSKILRVKKLNICGENLPIRIYTGEFVFENRQEIVLSDDEAIQICRGRMNDALNSMDIKNFKIVSEKVDSNADTVTVAWQLDLEENIVYEEKIDVLSQND